MPTASIPAVLADKNGVSRCRYRLRHRGRYKHIFGTTAAMGGELSCNLTSVLGDGRYILVGKLFVYIRTVHEISARSLPDRKAIQ